MTKPRHLIIDDLALILRKPRASPLVEPAEVIAIALSMVPSSTGHICSPESPAVRLILQSLKLAGWKIEPL